MFDLMECVLALIGKRPALLPLPYELTEEVGQEILQADVPLWEKQDVCAALHVRYPKFLWCRLVWPYAKDRIGGNREHWCPECEGPEDPLTPRQFKAGMTLAERYTLHEAARKRVAEKLERKKKEN